MPEETATTDVNQASNSDSPPAPTKAAAKKSTKKKKAKRKKVARKKNTTDNQARERAVRPYPASSFEEALPLAEAIHKYASGERVRRLTLLKQLDKSPTSSTTRMLITNSTKYGLTTGSFVAEWLELTPLGSRASDSTAPPREKCEAQFKLAIEGIAPFNRLYSEYKGKKLPTHDVLKDVLIDTKIEISNLNECVDIFIVNAKYLGLLQTIAGSETLIPIEQVLDEIGQPTNERDARIGEAESGYVTTAAQGLSERAGTSNIDWSKTCFVISPIGEEDSEIRQHADLFLSHLIEPALREFSMDVVRADNIGAAGMITSQILEYLMRSRLVIADLSFHNPNAFYEMAVRHACRLPIVQISRKKDRLPFDVNQVRTVVIDNSDIYSLVPKLETYRSEIATQVRAVLADGNTSSNPISVFFPAFRVVIPAEK